MKKLLFGLICLLVPCFGYCQNVYNIFNGGSSFNLSPSSNKKEVGIGQCVFSTCAGSCTNNNSYLHFYTSSGGELGQDLGTGRRNQYSVHCFDFTGFLYSTYSSNFSNMRISTLINFQDFCTGSSSDCPTCEECQECQECQECPVCDDTSYITFTNGGMSPLNYTISGNEINVELPISLSGYSISYSKYGNLNDFVVNDLSPGCSLDCDDLSGLNWSALYINNIQHLSSPIIRVDIPDYISWDYSSDEEEFNLYIGSGYDVDYINSIIDINSYRPSSEDFTRSFVGGLTLIFPYIFIALLILFIWKLVKRIFK